MQGPEDPASQAGALGPVPGTKTAPPKALGGRGPHHGTSVPRRIPGLPVPEEGLTRASTPGRAWDPSGPCPARHPEAQARPATTGGPEVTSPSRHAGPAHRPRPLRWCASGPVRWGARPPPSGGVTVHSTNARVPPAPRRPGAACRRPRPRPAGSRRRPVRPCDRRLTPAQRGADDAPGARPRGPRGRAASVALSCAPHVENRRTRRPGTPPFGGVPPQGPRIPTGECPPRLPLWPAAEAAGLSLYRGPYISTFPARASGRTRLFSAHLHGGRRAGGVVTWAATPYVPQSLRCSR